MSKLTLTGPYLSPQLRSPVQYWIVQDLRVGNMHTQYTQPSKNLLNNQDIQTIGGPLRTE